MNTSQQLCAKKLLLFKDGPSDLGNENFTKILKYLPYTPKAFRFSFIKPSSRKPSDNRRNEIFTTAKVDTDGKHGLLLHEQLAHLHTGNTLKKVSNIASDEDIMENNYVFGML